MTGAAVPVLELAHVSAGYGPFRALFDVDLAVGEGEAVALLGANGQGKTTVARVASGLVAPTAGSVCVGGQELAGAPAHRFARAGVAHAPEGRSVFATHSAWPSFERSQLEKTAAAFGCGALLTIRTTPKPELKRHASGLVPPRGWTFIGTPCWANVNRSVFDSPMPMGLRPRTTHSASCRASDVTARSCFSSARANSSLGSVRAPASAHRRWRIAC